VRITSLTTCAGGGHLHVTVVDGPTTTTLSYGPDDFTRDDVRTFVAEWISRRQRGQRPILNVEMD